MRTACTRLGRGAAAPVRPDVGDPEPPVVPGANSELTQDWRLSTAVCCDAKEALDDDPDEPVLVDVVGLAVVVGAAERLPEPAPAAPDEPEVPEEPEPDPLVPELPDPELPDPDGPTRNRSSLNRSTLNRSSCRTTTPSPLQPLRSWSSLLWLRWRRRPRQPPGRSGWPDRRPGSACRWSGSGWRSPRSAARSVGSRFATTCPALTVSPTLTATPATVPATGKAAVAFLT